MNDAQNKRNLLKAFALPLFSSFPIIWSGNNSCEYVCRNQQAKKKQELRGDAKKADSWRNKS